MGLLLQVTKYVQRLRCSRLFVLSSSLHPLTIHVDVLSLHVYNAHASSSNTPDTTVIGSKPNPDLSNMMFCSHGQRPTRCKECDGSSLRAVEDARIGSPGRTRIYGRKRRIKRPWSQDEATLASATRASIISQNGLVTSMSSGVAGGCDEIGSASSTIQKARLAHDDPAYVGGGSCAVCRLAGLAEGERQGHHFFSTNNQFMY